jgi:hypothetical protein
MIQGNKTFTGNVTCGFLVKKNLQQSLHGHIDQLRISHYVLL